MRKTLKRTVKNMVDIARRLWAGGGGYRRLGKFSVIKKPMRIIGKKYIFIGENVHIMNGIRMEAVSKWLDKSYSPAISIMDDVMINQNCHITCANRIQIGRGTSVSPDVLITDIEHRYVKDKSNMNTGLDVGEVEIGNFVTIGMGVRILGHRGVKIGDNSVIGANAVVTSDIPKNAVAVGIPAKVIKIIE